MTKITPELFDVTALLMMVPTQTFLAGNVLIIVQPPVHHVIVKASITVPSITSVTPDIWILLQMCIPVHAVATSERILGQEHLVGTPHA